MRTSQPGAFVPRPGPFVPGPAPFVTRPSPRLRLGLFHRIVATTLLAGLGAVALLDLADLVLTLWRLYYVAGDRIAVFRVYDLVSWTRTIEGWHVMVSIGCAVVWLLWQTLVAASNRVPRAALRYAVPMHFFAWFLPLVNLFMPLQNMADLRFATEIPLAQREGSALPRRRITPLLLGWWVSWLLSLPTFLFSFTIVPYAFLEITPAVGVVIEAAMGIVQVVNTVLAATVVGEIFWRIRAQEKAGVAPIAPF